MIICAVVPSDGPDTRHVLPATRYAHKEHLVRAQGQTHHSAKVHHTHCCCLLNDLPADLILSRGQGSFQQHPECPCFQEGLPVRAPHAFIPLCANGVASQEGNGRCGSGTHMPSTCTNMLVPHLAGIIRLFCDLTITLQKGNIKILVSFCAHLANDLYKPWIRLDKALQCICHTDTRHDVLSVTKMQHMSSFIEGLEATLLGMQV